VEAMVVLPLPPLPSKQKNLFVWYVIGAIAPTSATDNFLIGISDLAIGFVLSKLPEVAVVFGLYPNGLTRGVLKLWFAVCCPTPLSQGKEVCILYTSLENAIPPFREGGVSRLTACA